MSVLDIGAGTGFLSFLASKFGARECTLVEQGEVIRLARKLAEENHITNCRFIQKHSSELKDRALFDLVISETLGNFATEEHIIENMEDGKKFLKPGGTLLPESITQYVAPVISDRVWKEVNIWDTIGLGLGLGFGSMKKIALQNMYVQSIRENEILMNGIREWDRTNLYEKNSSVRKGTAEWSIAEPVTIFGFACFWDCQLAEGIHLSTSPLDPETHWEQIYLPLLEPLHLNPSQTLKVVLTSDTRRAVGVNVTWETEVCNGGKRIAHSTMKLTA